MKCKKFSRLTTSYDRSILINKVKEYFKVKPEDVLVDYNNNLVIAIDNYTDKNTLEEKLKQDFISFSIDPIDPEDPDYFIFRISDPRLTA